MLGFCVVCLFVIFMSTVLKGYASFSGIYVVCYVFYFRGRLLSDFQCGRLTCRTMLTVLKQCISLHYCLADNTHGKDEANLLFWLAMWAYICCLWLPALIPCKKKNCVKQAYKGYNLCTMSGVVKSNRRQWQQRKHIKQVSWLKFGTKSNSLSQNSKKQVICDSY